MINFDKIHTSYAPFQERTKGASFQHYLHASLIGAPYSKTYRFVAWIRNVDEDYAPSRLRSAGKIAIASAAVFGMIVTSPLLIGAVMLFKFTRWNYRISRALSDIPNYESLREKATVDHQALINSLGGEAACDQIPVVENLNVYNYLKVIFSGGIPTFFYPEINQERKEEILKTFNDLHHHTFQVKGNFVAILIEEKKTQVKSFCVIHKIGSSAHWQFLANANRLDYTLTGFGGSATNETSLQTIADIVAGNHDKYQLAQFK